MSDAQKKGNLAEKQACNFLLNQGLTLLTRNFRSRFGEIDLIMQDGENLVFVEVRFRKKIYYGSGAESVTHQKQIKLSKTALFYLQCEKKWETSPCRFDVVSLSEEMGKNKISWISNAFQLKI